MSAADVIAATSELLGDACRAQVPLAPLTTYKVGGSAALFVTASSPADLARIASVVGETGIETLIVGRGSNLLVADDGFAGLAVQLGDWADRVEIEQHGPAPGDPMTVDAGALTSLPVLARRCAAAGATGLEWAVGVPGSVGGAVRMNAGGHGSDIAESVIDVSLVDLHTGQTAVLEADRLGLRFRGSDIGDHQVVTSARFRASVGDRATAEAQLSEIVKWRREHQPGGQNAGSVFVNPIPGQLAAGQLIDDLGLRGARIGTAEVSTKHANFIQADPGGRAGDVRALIEHVRAAVEGAHGLRLRSEIRLVGFSDVEHEHSAVDLGGAITAVVAG